MVPTCTSRPGPAASEPCSESSAFAVKNTGRIIIIHKIQKSNCTTCINNEFSLLMCVTNDLVLMFLY